MLGSACIERYASSCKARITAPSTGFTHAALTACDQAYATATCAATSGSSAIPACAFKGGLALDAPCAFDEQCTSGKCSSSSSSCGKCVAATANPPVPAEASLGEACDNAGQTAPRCSAGMGLWCDATTKKCAAVPLVALGQPCGVVGESVAMCSAGGRCDYGANGAGTCVAETPVGGTCTDSEECALFTSCVAGKCGYATAADICK